jgi:hypothetical protein
MHALYGRLPLTETIAAAVTVSADVTAASKIDFAKELDQEIFPDSTSVLTKSGDINFTALYLAVARKGPRETLRELGE